MMVPAAGWMANLKGLRKPRAQLRIEAEEIRTAGHHALVQSLRESEEIGTNIRRLRTEAGIKQKDLAIYAGVSKGTISRIETDEVQP
jgi:DNA-binding transcriptional regulator YiaG